MSAVRYFLQLAGAKIDPRDVGLHEVSANASTIGSVMNTVYLLAGIVAVIVLVLAGFRYVISQGDAKNIEAAKNMILGAVIGLVVVISAFTITQFILGRIN